MSEIRRIEFVKPIMVRNRPMQRILPERDKHLRVRLALADRVVAVDVYHEGKLTEQVLVPMGNMCCVVTAPGVLGGSSPVQPPAQPPTLPEKPEEAKADPPKGKRSSSKKTSKKSGKKAVGAQPEA